ncbi:MAG: fimbrillin family protein, partial [Muribaculaceae bacterium]|nr:fimbrillin family protein [Muribaculaceae bacterium]
MNTKKLIYMVLGTLFMLSSCAENEPIDTQQSADDNRIYFRSYLPGITLSRSKDVTKLSTCQVTCFNPDDTTLIDSSTGELKPYFPDTRFKDDGTGRFFSNGDDECVWPDANSTMQFFAYYPPVDSMKKISGDTFFNLINHSGSADGATFLDYRLERFRVAKDIADQVDFLTACTSGSLSSNATTGIKLDFKHQLARVELTAWGASDKYDFEIAGVR